MSPTLRAGLAGLLGAAVVAVALPVLEPLDTAMLELLQALRDCGTESFGWALGIAVGPALAVAALLALARRPSPRATGLALASGASGAVLVEAAKTLVERLRPDQMPGVEIGNAFPSGHVTNTAVIAAAIVLLARDRRLPRGGVVVGGLALLAVALQAWSRIVLGSHWPSDVIASASLGAGWACLVHGLAGAGVRGIAIGGIAAGALVLPLAAGVRVSLPSPHAAPEPIAVVDFDDPGARAAAGAPWIHGHREPIGVVAWLPRLEGEITLPRPPEAPSEIRLGIRPTTRGRDRRRGCVRVELAIGEWRTPPITLFRGWRELRIDLPESISTAEPPRLRFRILIDEATAAAPADFGWVGLRWIRVYG